MESGEELPYARATAQLEITVPIEDASRRDVLYGPADRNLRLIRDHLQVKLTARDGVVRISGPVDAVQKAVYVLEELQRSLRHRFDLPPDLVLESLHQASNQNHEHNDGSIDVFHSGTAIAPRGEGQKAYLEAMMTHDLTFCLGPAGTGKTYLAVAVAVSMLKRHKIKRIVLARPAVEAGEKLGFLPGDLQAKVNPYLRPLFDAMHDMMTFDQLKRFMQNDVIEVVPLAYMRGRTMNNALIILDEAQNATVSQMLMFLTRLGNHSKMVVTGDDSQSDLPGSEANGFIDAAEKLRNVAGVAVIRLTTADIVRHPLVQRIVDAYGRVPRNV